MTRVLGSVLRRLRDLGGRLVLGAISRASRAIQRFTKNVLFLPAALARVTRAMLSLRAALVGVIGIGGLTILIRQISRLASEGDKLAKTARSLGLSVEFFTRLTFAAQQSGAEVQGLNVGLRTFNRNIGEFARSGSGPGQRALESLGLSAKDLKDTNGQLRDTEDLFLDIADRIGELGSEQEKISVLFDLFGRSSQDFVILFEKGADGIRELFDEAERLGGVLTPEQAKIAEDLTDSFGRVRFALVGVRQLILQTLGPSLIDVVNRSAQAIVNLRGQIESILKTGLEVLSVITTLGANLNETVQRLEFPDEELEARVGETIESGVRIVEESVLQAIIGIFLNALRLIGPEIVKLQVNFALFFVSAILEALVRFTPTIVGVLVDLAGIFVGAIVDELSRIIPLVQNFVSDVSGGPSSQSIQDRLAGGLADLRGEAGGGILEALTNIRQIGREGFSALTNLANIFRDTTPAANAATEAITQNNEEVSQATLRWREFAEGVRLGATQAAASFADLNQFGQTFGSAIVNGINNITSSLVNAIVQSENLGDAFVAAAAQMLTQIATLIAQLLVLRILASFIPGFGALTGVPGFGGGFRGGRAQDLPIQSFDAGGKVLGPAPPTPTTDNIPAMLQADEWVVRANSARYYGDQIMRALNDRAIPRSALARYGSAGASPAGGGGFNTGGRQGPAQGSQGPVVVPAVVASEDTMEALVGGGPNALLTFLNDFAPEARQALGISQ